MVENAEKQLWVRWKEHHDEAARERLILDSMRIVKYVAGRIAIHVPNSVEMDDLVGWGVLGLLDAVDKFNHLQEVKFSTYASIRIRGAIIDQIRSLDWAPRSLRAMARKVGAARDKLRHEKGLEPSSEDVAQELGTTSEHVDETMSQLQVAHVLSLDDYLLPEDRAEGRKLDTMADDTVRTPEDNLRQSEKQEILVDAIMKLPEQQQKVLNLYYYEELTLKEIGAVLEVSESRICQVHGAAVKTLRKAVQGGL